MFSNLHTHTNFSDGSSPPDDYIKEALRLGFRSLGFSDHSPLPFDNTFALREEKTQEYCDTIIRLKNKYKGKLDILLGMEVDFIPGVSHPPSWFRRQFPLDFIIGSVHLVKDPEEEELWFIDGPHAETYDNGLSKVFGGDIRKAVTVYYRQLQELIAVYKPDVVGHLDKIKMHNKSRYFDENEPWYRKLVDETLVVMLDAGCLMEVNTRGIYKKRSETLFPGSEVLRKAHSLGIRVTITSDAHKPHELSLYMKETAAILKQAGYRTQIIFTASGVEEVHL